MQMKYLLMLPLLCACSQLKWEAGPNDAAKEIPSWVYAPYDACIEARELCTSGEAQSMAQSDLVAKNNLASIFEVKIKSEFSAYTSSSSEVPNVHQDVQRSLTESVDQILEAVQIRDRFQKGELYFSLASLDRKQGAELLRSRIFRIDEELAALWEHRGRTKLRKLFKLTLERQRLNERYSILSGSLIPERISYREVLKWREARPKPEPLALHVGQAPDWLTEKLSELLTEAGFRLVKGEAPKVLSLNVSSIHEYLNVKGFEKYTFTLNLTSIVNGEKKKVLTASETVTGRTQADALLKVRNYFDSYIEEHLSDLQLD